MTPSGKIENYKVNNSYISVHVIQNINYIMVECPIKYSYYTTMPGNFQLKMNQIRIYTLHNGYFEIAIDVIAFKPIFQVNSFQDVVVIDFSSTIV